MYVYNYTYVCMYRIVFLLVSCGSYRCQPLGEAEVWVDTSAIVNHSLLGPVLVRAKSEGISKDMVDDLLCTHMIAFLCATVLAAAC